MPRIVLLGPPGSGKGTQSKWIAESLGVPHLSTGDLLRSAVREGTELGREADRFMRAGELVPDALVLAILGERLAEPDARKGYLLDGYPRNVAQAESLDRIAPVERVISFEIPERELLPRLTGRRSCPKCGTVYNLETHPPKVAGRCDRDGEALVKRSDDHEAAARNRLEVYRKETAPLLAFYESRHVLSPIDATGTPDEVTARIRRVIG